MVLAWKIGFVSQVEVVEDIKSFQKKKFGSQGSKFAALEQFGKLQNEQNPGFFYNIHFYIFGQYSVSLYLIYGFSENASFRWS